MHDSTHQATQYYAIFQATEESLHRSVELNCSKKTAVIESLTEQWMLFYIMLGVTGITFPFYMHYVKGEPLIAGMFGTLVCSSIAIPLGLMRFRRTYRIMREGVAVVGIVISDSSPLAMPLMGNSSKKTHKGLRMTYIYHYEGERYTGITGEVGLKRPTGMLPPIRSVPDSTGVCKLILIDPQKPEIARSTPEDVFINKTIRKRISEELGLICLQ